MFQGLSPWLAATLLLILTLAARRHPRADDESKEVTGCEQLYLTRIKSTNSTTLKLDSRVHNRGLVAKWVAEPPGPGGGIRCQ